LLGRQIASGASKVTSWYRDLSRPGGLDRAPSPGDRDAIIALQWLVAIATSYLVFTIHEWNPTNPLCALLVSICLVSTPLLQRIPEQIFEKGLIEPGLLVIDSIVFVLAISLSPEMPWDLLLLFFFCVFIAAVADNLVQICVGCTLLSLAFIMLASLNAKEALVIGPKLLIRVPFIFGISVVYGHLAGQVKREKRRREKVEEMARLKGQLVSALAHDIKTPLNVIQGHAELLGGAFGGQPDPTARLFSLNCIHENIDRIVKLITDFLHVSKLETLKLKSVGNLIHMNGVIEDVVQQQMVSAREKNLRVTLDLDKDLQSILGDKNQLERVLWNLVSNAVKFTPAGGNITVASRMVKKNISIRVTNTGSEIPEEEISGLFSEYKRLKGAANTEGTGLGLFIVKTIVEAHAGTVSVESEPGTGTTFTLLLPTQKGNSTRLLSKIAMLRPESKPSVEDAA
jgi:signal transduction histidine kinase